MTDKTPLTKLRDECIKALNGINDMKDEYSIGQQDTYSIIIDACRQLLPEEKQAIVDAYQAGWEVGDGDADSSNNGDDYFTQKYKACHRKQGISYLKRGHIAMNTINQLNICFSICKMLPE